MENIAGLAIIAIKLEMVWPLFEQLNHDSKVSLV